MYLLGAFVVGVSSTITAMLYFYPVPDPNHDAIMMAIGVVLGWGGHVVGYFYGSSKSSSDKNEMLSKKE